MFVFVYDLWVTTMIVNDHLQSNFTTQQINPITTLNQFCHNAKLYIILCAVWHSEINLQIFQWTLTVTCHQMSHGSWDCAIHMVTRTLAGQLRSYSLIPGRSNSLLSTSKHLYWLWTPFSLLFNGYWDLSLRVNQSGHEAAHSPPYSAEDDKECSYTSTLPYTFMAYAQIFTFIWNIIFLTICFVPSAVFVSHKKKKKKINPARFSQ